LHESSKEAIILVLRSTPLVAEEEEEEEDRIPDEVLDQVVKEKCPKKKPKPANQLAANHLVFLLLTFVEKFYEVGARNFRACIAAARR
jgi:hypothetical protein